MWRPDGICYREEWTLCENAVKKIVFAMLPGCDGTAMSYPHHATTEDSTVERLLRLHADQYGAECLQIYLNLWTGNIPFRILACRP